MADPTAGQQQDDEQPLVQQQEQEEQEQEQEQQQELAQDPERELLATARAWAAAIVSNKAAQIAEFVAGDWVIVSAAGISPGAHLLELVAAGELTHSSMNVVGTTHVRLLGSTAILTARVTNVAHYRGERFDADEWTTDVFVRRGDRWVCTLTHYTGAQTSP